MSSVSNKYITNQEAVPIIESDIFSGHEDNRFALGVFSPEETTSYTRDSILQAYLRLRANVYIDQTGMLEGDLKRHDGTELDENDERSTHLVLIENKIGRVAVFACMRLIQKTLGYESPLPIEEFFPEAFSTPAPLNSVEVSRFISRHDSVGISLITQRDLMTAGLAHVLDNNLGPVFGVVEPAFEKGLEAMKLPMNRIAEPKLVPEYNDENLGFEVDAHEFKRRIGEAAVKRMTIPVGSFAYWGKVLKSSGN